MKTYLLAAALVCGSAFYANAQTAPAPTNAQTSPAPATDGNTPAVATPSTVNPTAPVVGANSFTEAQAETRMTDAGYSVVTELMLDDNGIWQAKAMKDGKPVAVSLDYQGNIVAK